MFGLTPLGVIEGVSQYEILLILDLIPRIGQFPLGHHALLQLLHLREIIVPHLQALLLQIDELQALAQGPTVLLHEIGHQDSTGPRLAVDRMDQAALPRLHGLLDEGEDGIDGVVFLIEDL